LKKLAEQQAAYGETRNGAAFKPKRAMSKTPTKILWPRRVAEGVGSLTNLSRLEWHNPAAAV
jgi:hypothetical protein